MRMRMPGVRGRGLLAAMPLAVALTVLTPTQAQAAPTDGPDYEMPFPCGDSWLGSSRSYHSPSPYAVDWTRYNTLGSFTVSSAPGVVSRVANLGNTSYGRYVIVDHGNGNSSLFAHLQAQWVTQGQAIDQGDLIGRVGSTGGSTGPHLHFEQRIGGTDQRTYYHRQLFAVGSTQTSTNCPDTPITGDWDGDGVTDIGVFRRKATAVFRTKVPGVRASRTGYGVGTDVGLTGDWDGDGKTDLGVRRPNNRTFYLRQAGGGETTITMGRVRDVPVTGDWDGNGRTDVGVWNPGTRVFTLLYPRGRTYSVTLGNVGGRPVTGDWNGDGDVDLGVWTPSTATFKLRNVTPGGSVSYTSVRLGTPGDLPVTGDWNGDGVGDLGVWSPTTGVMTQRTTPSGGRAVTYTTKRFGIPRR